MKQINEQTNAWSPSMNAPTNAPDHPIGTLPPHSNQHGAHVGRSRRHNILVDGMEVSLPALVGAADDDGVCTIGLPPQSSFSLAEVNKEFLYVIKYGRIIGMPDETVPAATSLWSDRRFIFKPGDLIDTRIFANIPLHMETTTWTELSRIPCGRIRGDLVRRLRNESLSKPYLHETAARAIKTSKALACDFKNRPQKRPTTLDGWYGNNAEPMYVAMIRDPIVRMIMKSDGVTEQDVHDAIVSLQRL